MLNSIVKLIKVKIIIVMIIIIIIIIIGFWKHILQHGNII